jgi:hypothetical protein
MRSRADQRTQTATGGGENGGRGEHLAWADFIAAKPPALLCRGRYPHDETETSADTGPDGESLTSP